MDQQARQEHADYMETRDQKAQDKEDLSEILSLDSLHRMARRAKTPFETSVIGFLRAGLSIRDVVSSYEGVSERQILNVLARLYSAA